MQKAAKVRTRRVVSFSGSSSGDFANGFVKASMVVGVGAMVLIGVLLSYVPGFH